MASSKNCRRGLWVGGVERQLFALGVGSAVHEVEAVYQVGMFSRVQAPKVHFVSSSARQVDVMDQVHEVEAVYQVHHDRILASASMMSR